VYYTSREICCAQHAQQPCIDVCVEVDVTCEHVGSGELMWKREDEIEERERGEREREREHS